MYSSAEHTHGYVRKLLLSQQQLTKPGRVSSIFLTKVRSAEDVIAMHVQANRPVLICHMKMVNSLFSPMPVCDACVSSIQAVHLAACMMVCMICEILTCE